MMGMPTEAQCEPAARPLLENARKTIGFVPNMHAMMANLPALLQSYVAGYDLFRREAGFTPVEQEVAFLTISFENGCHYCMGAHSVIADMMSKVPPAVTEALRAGKTLPDARLETLRRMTRTMMAEKGRPPAGEIDAFLAAGFTERHLLGLILAISVKTLSNYTNRLLDTPLDQAFQARAWTAAA